MKSRPPLHDLADADLEKRIADARQELFTLRLQRAAGKLTNPARVVLVRRAVARLLTELGARRQARAAGAPRERAATGGRA
jgi:large subunit ribosomal protein L29